MNRRFGVVLALALMAGGGTSRAESSGPGIDGEARERVIDAVLKCLNENYISRDVAREMERAVRERAEKGDYDRIEAGEDLARALTNDLRAVCHDLHVRVEYSPEAMPTGPDAPHDPPAEAVEAMRLRFARENHGLSKVEVLPGNVGYMNFRYFAPLEHAAATYAAGMGVVADTDALILDLRENGGSMDPDTLPFLCGYFFARPVHLDDIYWRPNDSTRQFWTAPHVPGRRYLDRPIYVLTSGRTFSGAESLAYNLKHLDRATLVGSTTGGGANPGGTMHVDDHFAIFVPCGRTTNAVTGTNWEGVGVAPDVAVPARSALNAAHTAALERSIKSTTDPEWRHILEGALSDLRRDAPRIETATFRLEGHPEASSVTLAGDFNYWSPTANPLRQQGEAWVIELPVEAGRIAYKFVVDGEWILDPANPETEGRGEHTNSIRVVGEGTAD